MINSSGEQVLAGAADACGSAKHAGIRANATRIVTILEKLIQQ
jgi:hypothetical protein